MSHFAIAMERRPRLVGLLILLIPVLLAACTPGKGGY